ncbi:MAG: DUF167 domain-containing protein [Rhizobiales bacterium]|nr:DUF167 domain-containing protein [Hyphomicrobiales bacterium]
MPWRLVRDGLLVSVRVTPKSALDEISGLREAADGEVSLAVKVRAQPEQGRANKAVIQLLASAMGLPKSRLSVAAGEAQRNKTILIAGDAAELSAQLAAIVADMKE